MTDQKACVVHYNHLKSGKLTSLTNETFQRLHQAKDARNELGGDNVHTRQAEAIPDVLDSNIHCVHMACYKKYTKGIAVRNAKHKREVDSGETPLARKKRNVDSSDNRGLFPKKCMNPNCGTAKSIKVKGKKQEIALIQTKSACETILQAANLKNDSEMMLAIGGQDLIAKEFMMHRKCYKDYTRICSKSSTASTQNDQYRCQTNSSELLSFVENHIIGCKQSASMKLLTEIYGFNGDDTRLRAKVKQKLEEHFPGELLFISVSYHQPLMVISQKVASHSTLSTYVQESQDFILAQAANILQMAMKTMMESAGDLPWPPTSDSLGNLSRKAPECLVKFLMKLIQSQSTHHTASNDSQRVAESISQDLIYAYSKGKFLTQKHTLLGIGLHNMTGKKNVVSILARLGHSISYDQTRLIETAQAELAQEMTDMGCSLPLTPSSAGGTVPTYFWWDNFDCMKENNEGSVHTTHGIAFQERDSQGMPHLTPEIQPSRRRTVEKTATVLPQKKINPHTNPPGFSLTTIFEGDHDVTSSTEVFMWKLLRQHYSSAVQLVPSFVGWVIQLHEDPSSQQTLITFLPPIISPITQYSTVLECIKQSQLMAAQANMKYAHITTDVGAAAKFYHVIWNNPGEFHNVIIHLGDMHAIMEFFGTIGKFISASGFEEVIYQAGLCTSGAMKGVLSGKHYNRSWIVHETFSEALHRLFVESYMPDVLNGIASHIHDKTPIDAVQKLSEGTDFSSVEQQYRKTMSQVLQGDYGKTPQYWAMYMKAVDRQHTLHLAINRSDYDLRLKCWTGSLPFCFAMNKQNYARYGSFYCRQLMTLDDTHPGARAELHKGLSVCRNNTGIRQSVDAAGEQTFMKNSKTPGGIKNFSHQETAYRKWVLNRPFTSAMVSSLLEVSNLSDTSQNPRKCLRRKEIHNSEDRVIRTMDVIKSCFINPFSPDIDPSKLFNIVSGKPLCSEVEEHLLSTHKRGSELHCAFNTRLDMEKDAETRCFFDPIPRSLWRSFQDSNKRTTLQSARGQIKNVAVQRDILGVLAAKSSEENMPVNLDKALTYPLAPVPLSLATPDGTRRSTPKCQMMEVVLTSLDSTNTANEIPENAVYIIDLVAYLRSLLNVPDTFRLLARRVMADIPIQYKVIYFACDSYSADSIKQSERTKRGQSDKYILRTPDIRIPVPFAQFMCNGENKDRMLELIEQVLREERALLSDRIVYYARGKVCMKITSQCSEEIPSLASDHIEADTKICYLTQHALKENSGDPTVCVVRSSSGDTDIPIILLGNECENLKVIIDNGSGKSRQVLDLSRSHLTDIQKQALIGTHAFSGNDYVSSFFRKGKKTWWKVIKDDEHLLKAFAELGNEQQISSVILDELQRATCAVYNQRRYKRVNEARASLFWSQFHHGKIADLSALPPCESALALHGARSNYVARMWRLAHKAQQSLDTPVNHGWKEDLSIHWVDIPYPHDVVELLCNKAGEDREEELSGYSEDSDSDCD